MVVLTAQDTYSDKKTNIRKAVLDSLENKNSGVVILKLVYNAPSNQKSSIDQLSCFLPYHVSSFVQEEGTDSTVQFFLFNPDLIFAARTMIRTHDRLQRSLD